MQQYRLAYLFNVSFSIFTKLQKGLPVLLKTWSDLRKQRFCPAAIFSRWSDFAWDHQWITQENNEMDFVEIRLKKHMIRLDGLFF
jgi:hypothetical protein